MSVGVNQSAVTAQVHMGIAEQGKIHALEGDHETALSYYRFAIDMTVQAKDPEVFFRHYLECVLESLELMGSYDAVLEYCVKAVDLLTERVDTDADVGRELLYVYLRQGAVALKAGDDATARAALEKALLLSDQLGIGVPLARTLYSWMGRGYRLDAERITAEQRRTRYFSVRRDTVDPGRARKLPSEKLNRLTASP